MESSTDNSEERVTVSREIHKNISGKPVMEKVKANIVTSTGSKLSENMAIEKESLIHNCIIYIISQILGMILLVLLGSLILQHFGGFPHEMFKHALNYHPMFMVVTLILVTSRRLTNICRLPLLAASLVLQSTGALAIVSWHFKKGEPHMQTMHSWFGVMTIISFLFYMAGNLYLYTRHEPKKDSERQKFLNRINKSILYVRMIGLGCLVMAMITSLLGLNQFEDVFTGKSADIEYSTSNPSSPRLLINIAAIFLIIYVGFMAYLTARQRYRSFESIEFEQQVQMAVDHAMQQMEASGAFKSKRSNLSTRSDQSLSPTKSANNRTNREQGRSPRISVPNTRKFSPSSSLSNRLRSS
ncbi:hypothetical protein BLA29_003634 [Euroglyphus maynei]|uniref:Cytochrome b561 domain-containing protein n=1 Tax=Euroglyphus maynei TaxID=6958 RepID=A0A1Y3AVY4_EURMA|nr:hypothetical protein BLA29_003634 [Euroglyphus maynei]